MITRSKKYLILFLIKKQINSNPAISTPNKFMKKVVPQLIDDIFDLTIDLVLPSEKIEKNKSKIKIKNLKLI